jgi:hypothetical protein
MDAEDKIKAQLIYDSFDSHPPNQEANWLDEYLEPAWLKPRYGSELYADVLREPMQRVKLELKTSSELTKKARKTRSASKTSLRVAHVKRVDRISAADIALRQTLSKNLFSKN